MFDTEKFIDHVHCREAIWLRTSEDYADKDLRDKYWTEIAEEMFHDFHELSEEQQLLKGKQPFGPRIRL